jgi:hypothetical protein
VLNNTGQRQNGLRLSDALTNKKRRHKIGHMQSGLGNEFSHCLRSAETTGA